VPVRVDRRAPFRHVCVCVCPELPSDLVESCLDASSPLCQACTSLASLSRLFVAAVLASHPIEEKDWWVAKEEEDAAASPPPLYHTRTETAEAGTTEETHFHNRGYEVWEGCRQAWRHTAASDRDRITTSSSGRSPLRSPLRRRMMSSLVQKKQYALPRNLGLGEMVEVYQEIWHGDSSE
jgi:hypothetical protein